MDQDEAIAETGIWIAPKSVEDWKGFGYVVTEPQPKLNPVRRKYYRDAVHMHKPGGRDAPKP